MWVQLFALLPACALRPGGAIGFEEYLLTSVSPNEITSKSIILKAFKDFDVDFSGMLGYSEFAAGVRERLKIKPSELAEIGLKALWCAMDSDDSGYIESSEFHTLMGRKETRGKDQPRESCES